MSITKQFDRDVEQVTQHLPETLTWQDTDYEVNVSTVRDAVEPTEYADLEDRGLAVSIRLALFSGAHMALGDRVTLRGREHRVESYTTSSDQVVLRLTLKEVT